MIKKIVYILLLIPFTICSQSATGDLEDYIEVIISNAPGSTGDNYTVPSTANLLSWDAIVTDVLNDDIANARTKAAVLNYQVTEFTDTSITPNQVFYILEEKNAPSKYWGTYVFSKTPNRNNLVIQAPHSKYDTNTGKQATYVFKNLVAKALFINGTHRCNSGESSSCSGTTSVCGTSEAFRVSDLAHSTTSVFQKTTENLFNNISNSVFIQLHGFGKKSTDPYVILSNGTRITPAKDYASQLKNALFAVDNSLTFKLAHVDLSWTRLIGFTNTQGRLINNSINHCNNSATTTSGRFVHVEQEKSKLRNDVTGWAKMKTALANVFSTTLNVDEFDLGNEIKISPNPTNDMLQVKGKNISRIDVINSLGQVIQKRIPKDPSKPVVINLSEQVAGIYLLKITTDKGTVDKKVIKN